MAKKVSKKKTAKKAAKKAPAKKAVKKVVKKAAKVAKKAVKKAPSKKAAKKVTKKTAKKTTKKAAKKVAKKAVKKVAKKATKTVTKKAAKKVIKKAAKKATPAKKTVTKAAKKVAKKAQIKVAEPAPAKPIAKKAVKRARKATKVEEDLPPVVVKRRYVKPETVAKLSLFQKKQQQRLLDLRDQITDSMYGIQNDTIKNSAENTDTGGGGMHQGDAGSDAYDRDFALTMLSKEANALGEIEEALQRLELGTYGICEESGEKIPNPRLEAMPFARLTVECQARREKEHSKSDFSSREYGFN